MDLRTPIMITETQLKKMPVKDYMNQDQLDFFKHKLMELRTEIENNIEEFRQELADLQVETDENDRATIEEQRSLKLRLIERQSNVIPKILYSLRQIESGEYGYCEESGEPIGIERLLVRPTATLAIESKTLRERKEKVYRDDR